MKKRSTNFFLLGLFLLSILFLIKEPKVTIDAVVMAMETWKNKLFPSLFPFLVLSSLLIQYGFVDFAGELAKPLMRYCFHLKGETAIVLLLSMLSGFPSSAKYLSLLLEKKTIHEQEAMHLLKFCHFASPLFLIGTIITLLLKEQKLLLPLLLSHYLPAFLLGIVARPKEKPEKTKVSYRKAILGLSQKKVSFGSAFTDSVNGSFRTLFQILGVMIIFLVFRSVILSFTNFSELERILLSGILEMSQGVIMCGLSSLPLSLKGSIIAFFLSFGGLSIHMQVYSLLSKTNLKYRPYFFARLMHGLLSAVTFPLFLNLFS